MYIPIALIGGCGAFLIAENLNKVIKKISNKKYFSYIGLLTVTVLIIGSFFPFIEFVSSTGQKASDARLSHDFLVEKMDELDDECWIITMIPSVVDINGKNFLHAGFATDEEIMNKVLNENDCVFYYEDYWTYVLYNKTVGEYIHDNYKLTTYDSVRVRGTEYTLYYITWL
jgi:hypothetical protein